MSPRVSNLREPQRLRITRTVRRGLDDVREVVAHSAFEIVQLGGTRYYVDPARRRAWLVLSEKKERFSGKRTSTVCPVASPRIVKRLCRGLPRTR